MRGLAEHGHADAQLDQPHPAVGHPHHLHGPQADQPFAERPAGTGLPEAEVAERGDRGGDGHDGDLA